MLISEPRVRHRLHHVARIALVPLCALWLGCTGKTEQPAEVKNLQMLATLYGRYISTHRGQPPPDEAALKKFIPTLSADELRAMGVDTNNLDTLFTSPRDGQPYVVHYKQPGAVVAYERDGKEGKRLVAYPSGQVEEVDEARFKQLVPSAK
jgi:hypothetical protein